MKTRFIFLFILACFGSAKAQINTLKYYQEILSVGLCDKDDYFAKCFTLEKSCEFEMRKIAETCVLDNKHLFKQKDLRGLAAERHKTSQDIEIGFCMGQRFEKAFHSDKSDKTECYSVKKWK